MMAQRVLLSLLLSMPSMAMAQGVTPVSGTVNAAQSGTWTVQPGNTANTTPWVMELSQTGTKNDVDVASLPANASVNLNQYGGSAVGAGNALHVQPGTGANFATTEQSSAAILSGQQAVNGTAASLANNTVKEVCVKALLANTSNVYVGPTGVTTGTGLELGPGDSYCTRVTNTNALFVIAAGAGPSVSWSARN